MVKKHMVIACAFPLCTNGQCNNHILMSCYVMIAPHRVAWLPVYLAQPRLCSRANTPAPDDLSRRAGWDKSFQGRDEHVNEKTNTPGSGHR